MRNNEKYNSSHTPYSGLLKGKYIGGIAPKGPEEM